MRRAIGMAMTVTAMLTVATAGRAQPGPVPQAGIPAGTGSIMQISVRRPPMQADADFTALANRFAADARRVTSCEQANALAVTYRADMTITSPNRFAVIPPLLAQLLRSRPLGTPTPPYGKREQGVRILVLCPTSFRVQAPPRKGIGRREI